MTTCCPAPTSTSRSTTRFAAVCCSVIPARAQALPARARRRARRLPQPCAPRADAARLGGPADGEGAPRLLRDPGDAGGARRGLRRPARSRAPCGGRGDRPSRRGADRLVPPVVRRDRGGDLARGVGHGERGVPRVPDRPRRERPPLPFLSRAVREPDDAGHPRRPARGRRVPGHRASRDRGCVRSGDQTAAAPRFARTSRPASASRSRRSSARAAPSTGAQRTSSPSRAGGRVSPGREPYE